MDRHELMVGDWIETINQNKEVCRVQVNEIQEKQVLFYYQKCYYISVSYEHVHPIAITKSILENSGFEFNTPFYELDGIQIEILPSCCKFSYYDGKIDVYVVDSIRFKYVHELQHLLRLCGYKCMATNFKIE